MYKVIKTKQFIFLDQMSYLAAGTSLSSFIKAYDAKELKNHFPYGWFDSYEKRNYKVQDLTKTDFYSSLKNSVISKVDFNKLIKHCKKIIWF